MSKAQKSKDKRNFDRKKVKQAQKEVRKKRKIVLAIEGVIGFRSVPNRMSAYGSIGEEREDRQKAISNQVQTYRAQLKKLLEDFGKIPDRCDAKSVKHPLPVVLLFGLLSYLFQMTSRREANRDMSLSFFTGIARVVPRIGNTTTW